MHPGYFFDFPRESFLRRQPACRPDDRCSPRASSDDRSAARSDRDRLLHACPRRPAAGDLLVPLFSLRLGERAGASATSAICGAARRGWPAPGQRVLQLLPINEMAPGQQSPYSAISAMAIDPIFISLPSVPEFAAARRRSVALDARRRDAALVRVRRAARRLRERPRAQRTRAAERVRAILDDRSGGATRRARGRSRRSSASRRGGSRTTRSSARSTPRRASGRGPSGRRRCAARAGGARSTRAASWPRGPVPPVPAVARRRAVAGGARRDRTASQLFGDLPFMVDGDSADVWARQDQFRLDVSLGVPPDAFSATGQDWGMPVYRWDVIAARRFPVAARARAAQRRSLRRLPRRSPRRLLSHVRPAARRRRRRSSPRRRGANRWRSANGAAASSAAPAPRSSPRISASCPTSSAHRSRGSGVPGFRVFRWERYWHAEASRSAIPADYPAVSVATSGTHDTETLAVWWRRAPSRERQQVAALDERWSALTESARPRVRDALLEALLASAIRTRAVSGAGRLRLARSDQRAGDGQRRELDVPAAVAVESPRRVRMRASGSQAVRAHGTRTAVARHIISNVATLRPFRALRPTPGTAAAIAAVPYDVVSTEEARALADGNPLELSARVASRTRTAAGDDPYSPAVYERARREFRAAVRAVAGGRGRAEPLLLPAADGPHEQTGLAALLVARRVRTRRHQKSTRERGATRKTTAPGT